MFLDGITKSLGASNVRNCHLIASQDVIKFIVARQDFGVKALGDSSNPSQIETWTSPVITIDRP